MEQLPKFVKAIESKKKSLVDLLREAVAIPSVSSESAHSGDVVRMVQWAKKQLSRLGAKVEIVSPGKIELHDGSKVERNPILLASLGSDETKKTLLVYSHVDVEPAALTDGWSSDPFKLVEKDGKLCGRGATAAKGPIVAWIGAIQAMKKCKIECPVNVKFCFDSMGEVGSKGLEEQLRSRKDTFLSDVKFVCISEGCWLGNEKPCVTYGLRGLSYYFVDVKACNQDLHSGIFGGNVYEALADVAWVLNQLTDVNGEILIDGLNEKVKTVSAEELKLYESIQSEQEKLCKELGAAKLMRNTKPELLARTWQHPALSIHGIEGAFDGSGTKTVIPCKVTGKFSIRSVPGMTAEQTDKLVKEHLQKVWSERGSPNEFKIHCTMSGNCWETNFKKSHFESAARAIKSVFDVDPDFTRDGCTIPAANMLQEITGADVLVLPIGCADDMPNFANEKINVKNFIDGAKIFGAYLLELGSIL